MRRFAGAGPAVALAVIVSAWLWPVTLFNRRPVGGDVTSVFLPQMTAYERALKQDRWPLWDAQSGFGVPVHAAGQVGVLYPPNRLLYGLLEAHDAFAITLVLHLVLAAIWAFLCGRVFGLSRSGAMLTGLVFAGQGFFVVNLGRPWSTTSGCWLPLAAAAAWCWLSRGRSGWLLALAAVLAVQLLAGHFQVAFQTQVVVLLLAVLAPWIERSDRWRRLLRGLALPGVLAAAWALAAVQLVPTAELAARTDWRGRGLEYLSSFATPPWHVVNLLAPELWHRHPLWEPIEWVPARSLPTESLLYVGLLPIGLAVWGGWHRRRESSVRAATCLAVVGLLLSCGPWLPGFGWLVRCPGFGWFSSFARWSVVSGLGLSLLAGAGLDGLEVSRWRVWLLRYVATVAVLLAVGVTLVVLCARRHDAFGLPPDMFLEAKLLAAGYRPAELSKRSVTPDSELLSMLTSELTLPMIQLILLSGIGVVGWRSVKRKGLVACVLVWSAVDLGLSSGRLSRVDFAAARPIVEESVVLRWLAADPCGRTAGRLGFVPLMVDASTITHAGVLDMRAFWSDPNRDATRRLVGAFPTLEGPWRGGDQALRLAVTPGLFSDDDLVFLRLAGVRRLVCGLDVDEPHSGAALRHVSPEPLLDRWLSDRLAGMQTLRESAWRWSIWAPPPETLIARAWAFPVETPPAAGTDPRLLTVPPPARRGMLQPARPAAKIIDDGERVIVRGTTDGPSVLVLSDLFDPGWQAQLTQDGPPLPVKIAPAFGGWRAVEIPSAGPYEVTFRYKPDAFHVGVSISLGALGAWCVGLALLAWRRRLELASSVA